MPASRACERHKWWCPEVEYAVEAAAVAAERLSLPGAGEKAAHTFRNKLRLRALAGAAGVRNPEYAAVNTIAEAVAFFEHMGSACVLKPSSRQASVGVQIVSERAQVPSGWRACLAAREDRFEPDRGIASKVMMERFIEGPEFSVELLVSEGRASFVNVTSKVLLPGRFPVEIGHVVPANVGATMWQRLVDATMKVMDAAGLASGTLHCEWIVEGGEPVLVECAARLPGDEIPVLISLAYGFAMVDAYLRTLQGEFPTLPTRPRGGAAIRFLVGPHGIVSDVRGVDDARGVPGVEEVRVAVRPGDTLNPVTSSWDRAGYVLANGETGREAWVRAELAASRVAVMVHP